MRLSPSVRVLTFRSLAPNPFQWVPGQYVEFIDPDASASRAAYSIASIPDPETPGQFEVAVSDGTSASFMAAIEAGARLEIFGPRGSFVRRAVDAPALFVGVGTGIAPLRAMLLDALRTGSRGDQPRLLLLFGCRAREDILWEQELSALSAASPQFRFEPTLSQPEADWRGRRGYVQTHLAELAVPVDEIHVYICGSRAMVESCLRVLNEIGIERNQITGEGY